MAMRYAADHKPQTRQRILTAAARVFRRQGFQAGSVDDVMAEAGLTAGGFYAHFKSKDALFAAALVETLRQGRVLRGTDNPQDEQLTGSARVRSIAGKYLSTAHRRLVEQGCPMPPLVSELTRQSPATRRAFEAVAREIAAALAEHLPGDKPAERSDQALALLALMIGGLSLSRAVADEALADRILAACRQLVDQSLNSPPPAPRTRQRGKPRSSSPRKKGRLKP
jgi:TetR/AcrR family transcriptional repressor of nem operon